MAETIGFVGTGIMGTPMSKRLLAAGYQLVLYDAKPEAMKPLLALGAQAAASAADLGERCHKVITMLPNSGIVEAVVLGSAGLSDGLKPGSILIDMSSSLPTSTQKIAAALAAKGIEMIDAPVSGGMGGATDGTLAIMVGGKEELYKECLPLLQAMGKNIFHIGPVSTGHTMKAVNNMMSAINTLGVCEALVLGTKAGLDAAKIIEVCSTGSGQSYALNMKGTRIILADNFKPGFTTDLMYKDVDIATTLGRQLGVPLMEANMVHQILGIARGRGMNALDYTCMVKLIEEVAGIKVVSEQA
jgi:3-hydroxyisobutyrate dehydrogenase-like beta-hydroxyacid dehydrogenase